MSPRLGDCENAETIKLVSAFCMTSPSFFLMYLLDYLTESLYIPLCFNFIVNFLNEAR